MAGAKGCGETKFGISAFELFSSVAHFSHIKPGEESSRAGCLGGVCVFLYLPSSFHKYRFLSSFFVVG